MIVIARLGWAGLSPMMEQAQEAAFNISRTFDYDEWAAAAASAPSPRRSAPELVSIDVRQFSAHQGHLMRIA
ncbi:MAG: hypothetical protein ACREDT_01755 [Methylocella sp.]